MLMDFFPRSSIFDRWFFLTLVFICILLQDGSVDSSPSVESCKESRKLQEILIAVFILYRPRTP